MKPLPLTEKEKVDVAKLKVALEPLQQESCAINRKYLGKRFVERSAEDTARSKELWDACRRLNDEYDLTHPIEPCGLCGSAISASLAHKWPSSYTCQNIARCRAAPPFMGG